MINNASELNSLIDEILKKVGFHKNKNTWYFYSYECICFFTIEKAPHGSGYFGHLLGCFLRELRNDLEEFPKYYEKDLGYNLSEIIGKEIPKNAFDLLNNKFISNERELVITELFENYIIVFLKEVSSKEGIKEAIIKYPKLKFFLSMELKKLLLIPIRS